ncbi:hypothetical protein [Apilactobacillus zhangqiuensis]|uniref:hypothetical protein n=1 Tax=Apilactobacillus zhangqiuensis TaxID=2841031 RepID=UPI001C7DF7B4|nr:hypothetical protein [Apilactobacillus zhangqiuensis]
MNFIKNFKAKSPKAFWTIIVVVVALVVVGFANNNNNGSPISFSKTPQKMIEDGGTDKVWKLTANSAPNDPLYIQFGADNKLYGGDSKDNISTSDPAKYTFKDNDNLDIDAPGAFNMDLKNLKIENNKIKGIATDKKESIEMTLTPVN